MKTSARAAISGGIWARCDLPNQAMMRKSCTTQTFASTSLKFYSNWTRLFGTTFYWVIAKYYLLDFTIPFYPSHHFVYGGVLEINRTVVVYLPTYISMHRTRVGFQVP